MKLFVNLGALGVLCLFVVASSLSGACDNRPGPLDDQGNIRAAAISPSCTTVAVVGRYGRSYDGRLSLYTVLTGDSVASRLWPGAELLAVAFHPSETMLATSDDTGVIQLWRFHESAPTTSASLKLISQVAIPARANDLAFTRMGDFLYLACADQVIRVIDVSTNAIVAELRGHEGGVFGLAFSADGRRMASGGDGTIKVWDVRRRSVLASLDGVAAEATVVAFVPNQSWVIAAFGAPYSPSGPPQPALDYSKEQVGVWDSDAGELIRSFHVGGDRVTSLSLSPNGLRIAVGYTWKKPGPDNSVAIVKTATGQREGTIRGRWRAPISRWCGNGERVVVVDGRHITLWDVTKSSDAKKMWEGQWRWRDQIPRVGQVDKNP